MNPNETGYDALSIQESPDAVVVMTQQGSVLHWNAGANAVFGYGSAEALGRPIDDLIVPPDQAGEHARQLAETLANGLATFESLRRRKDGTLVYVDVSWKIVRVSGHDEPLILSTTKDVTALRVRRDTKQVESRYRDLLESTPDGIVMVNPTGHIVFTNSHAHELFGYGRGELAWQADRNAVAAALPCGSFRPSSEVLRGAPDAGDGRRTGTVRAAQGRHRIPGRNQSEPAARSDEGTSSS